MNPVVGITVLNAQFGQTIVAVRANGEVYLLRSTTVPDWERMTDVPDNSGAVGGGPVTEEEVQRASRVKWKGGMRKALEDFVRARSRGNDA